MQLLLKHGADAAARNPDGYTALQLAEYASMAETVALLQGPTEAAERAANAPGKRAASRASAPATAARRSAG